MPEYEAMGKYASNIEPGMILPKFSSKPVTSSFTSSQHKGMQAIGIPGMPLFYLREGDIVTVKVPVEPKREDVRVIVLDDGETYGPVEGACIVNVPGYVTLEEMDAFVAKAVEEGGMHFIAKLA